MVAWSCLGHNYSDRCPGCCTCLCSLLRGWVSSHFPGLTLTHRSLHSTSNPSPGPLPGFQAKQHSGLGSPCPWVKKQTKPNQENQTKTTLFFFVLEDTREEFTRTSECEPQNSLISGWLPVPTPLCPVNTNQHCRASARSPTFPKIHPSSNCVEGMAPSKVRIWLTVLEESYNYMPVTTTFPSRWVPKCHLPKATEKRHLEV